MIGLLKGLNMIWWCHGTNMADPSTCPKSALYRLYMYYLESVQDMKFRSKINALSFCWSKMIFDESKFIWIEPKLFMWHDKMYWNVQKNGLVQNNFEHHFGQAALIFKPKLIFKSWLGSTIHHKYLYHSIVHIRWPQMWRAGGGVAHKAAARQLLPLFIHV